jgi:glyoxylase-like metal-dependent hydrolase (beta-lactamase superfamily II)
VRGRDTVLVLDAGTGIRRLGMQIVPTTTRIDILLSHLHMDHIQGLEKVLDFPRVEVTSEENARRVMVEAAQGPFVQRVHPSIMWAKLRALVEGARLASKQLWSRRAIV